MILRDLGHYLAAQGRASRRDLARHFATSEDAVEAMLGIWMRKGRVRKCTTGGCSGSCCGKQSEVLFEWLPEGQIGVVQQA
ncbi:FeoC-like transcriptional regulator [Aeromonas diversa]|uniref:FeoC-like transcriptional regulator n=1 Tax=Aeromonas diversa TaxID=502790 RepID=UPI0039A2E718